MLFSCPKCGYLWYPKVHPPNYCPQCHKMLSDGTKQKDMLTRARSALRKIEDVEKFIELWNAGYTYTALKKEFKMTEENIYYASRALNLSRRSDHFTKNVNEREIAILDYLKKQGGYCELKELASIGYGAVQRLIKRRKVFRIPINLGRRPGGWKHNILSKVFTTYAYTESYHRKTFVCLDRTAVVRLLCRVLRKPENKNIQKTMTAYLRAYTTKAERYGILWNLGIRKFRSAKSTIQINGIVKPRRHKYE